MHGRADERNGGCAKGSTAKSSDNPEGLRSLNDDPPRV